MTIEALLDCSASQLEAMTDEQLMAHFAPMLDVTRPDRESAIYKEKKSSSGAKRIKPESELQILFKGLSPEKQALLLEEGIDLSDL